MIRANLRITAEEPHASSVKVTVDGNELEGILALSIEPIRPQSPLIANITVLVEKLDIITKGNVTPTGGTPASVKPVREVKP